MTARLFTGKMKTKAARGRVKVQDRQKRRRSENAKSNDNEENIPRKFNKKETHHDKRHEKAKRNEHRRAGRENHPLYAAVFDCGHIDPYVFTPNRSIAREYWFCQACGTCITTSWADPLGGCGDPIIDGLFQR
jgi:hypothetical protein